MFKKILVLLFSISLVSETIVVDGELNEPEWENAFKVNEFYETSPYSLNKTVNETIAYLFSNEDGIYVGFKNYQDESTMLSNKTMRDEMSSLSEKNSINIDFDGDRTKAYIIAVALGDSLFDAIKIQSGDFNLSNMKTSEDVGKLITAVSEVSKLEISQAKRFKIPENVTKENAAALLADELGFTEKFLNRRIEDGLLLGEELVAAREIFVAQGEKIMNLADKINTGVSTPAEKLEFRRQLAIYHGFHMHLKGFQTETARALQSFAIEVGGEDGALALAGRAREALEQLGGGEGITDDIAAAAANVVQEKGFKGLNRFIKRKVNR